MPTFEGTGIKNLKLRGGIYYWRQRIRGVQYSESLQTGNREEALRMAEEAVRLQAETSHNQRVLGIVAYELGDIATACRAFERAAALDPYDENNVRNVELCTQASSSTREPAP